MRPSARTTYLLIATLTIPFALFLWWTEADLRPRLELEVEESLAHQARLMHATIGTQAFSDSLADALGEASGSRVTLIDRTGRVVGDSEVGADRLPEVENHAARPEVAAALQGDTGSAIRSSETVSLWLLYVAMPDPRGVLRVSVPLSRADALVMRSRQWVLAGGLVTLFLVGLLGRRFVRFWQRPSPTSGTRSTRSGVEKWAGASVSKAEASWLPSARAWTKWRLGVEQRVADLSRERRI